MSELTARQTEWLDAITAFIKERGRMPSVRELAKAMGVASPNGVVSNLRALAQKGALKKDGRRWALVKHKNCPFCGRRM